ncbi:monocarboxylate transporter 2-like [Frankliniella occidentalis]|uniref:Monocarboxylate transporter 2-like n=1 Tax=Frankliniella occidentalis TaxID=133901 RepID=A0A9C6U0V4_FRAOC|nr:monocarboxylate transporter 2-like [Frankliniella occidentalis]
MTNMALFSVFGLLFGGQLEAWGLETTGVAVISSTMTSVQNFSGLLVGPLVKRLGARAVSLMGGLLTSCGMSLSYFATDPWHIFLTWGFLVGLGVGLLVPATFLNISAWFSTRRSQAVGISLAGTGLGQIALPHLVRVLLEEYGFHGCVLIIGALALHSIPGCLLFRKPRLIRDPVEASESQPLKPKKDKPLHEPVAAPPPKDAKPAPAVAVLEGAGDRHGGVLAAMKRVALAMDLDLFLNLRFMNLAVGTGLIYTTMTSFSMIFPFFLMETVGMSRAVTATLMSVQSGADLVSRLLLPQVMGGAKCGGHGLPARTVMIVGAVGSAASRSVMAELRGFTELIVMAAVTGMFRGATVLNQNLVIAEHVPAAKLPSAIGLAMVVKGACVLGFGSALGVVRDYSGSYSIFIHSLTALALVTAVSWALESLCCRASRRPDEDADAGR